jgi:hypothetical protein
MKGKNFFIFLCKNYKNSPPKIFQISLGWLHDFCCAWEKNWMSQSLKLTFIFFFCKHQDFLKSTDQGTFNLHIKLWKFSFWRKFEFKFSSTCAKYIIRMLLVHFFFFDNLGVQKIILRVLDGNCLKKSMKLFMMVGMDLFIILFLCTQWMERLFFGYSRCFFDMAQWWLDHMKIQQVRRLTQVLPEFYIICGFIHHKVTILIISTSACFVVHFRRCCPLILTHINIISSS